MPEQPPSPQTPEELMRAFAEATPEAREALFYQAIGALTATGLDLEAALELGAQAEAAKDTAHSRAQEAEAQVAELATTNTALKKEIGALRVVIGEARRRNVELAAELRMADKEGRRWFDGCMAAQSKLGEYRHVYTLKNGTEIYALPSPEGDASIYIFQHPDGKGVTVRPHPKEGKLSQAFIRREL